MQKDRLCITFGQGLISNKRLLILKKNPYQCYKSLYFLQIKKGFYYFVQVENASSLLEEASNLSKGDPYSKVARTKLIEGSRWILQGTSGVLLCFDESEVSVLINFPLFYAHGRERMKDQKRTISISSAVLTVFWVQVQFLFYSKNDDDLYIPNPSLDNTILYSPADPISPNKFIKSVVLNTNVLIRLFVLSETFYLVTHLNINLHSHFVH